VSQLSDAPPSRTQEGVETRAAVGGWQEVVETQTAVGGLQASQAAAGSSQEAVMATLPANDVRHRLAPRDPLIYPYDQTWDGARALRMPKKRRI
jgi:hypothetical protein